MTVRALLRAGASAAPVFTVLVLAQAATRDGYDLTRHPASMLALGDLGWIQTTTFVVTGLLTLAAAASTSWRAAGSRAVPVLLALVGAGLLVAAVFELDPADGFPIGTPAGPPAGMSGEMILHNVGGSVSFLSMIALCFTMRRAATGGRVAGTVFAAGLLWAMTGGTGGALTLFLGVVVAWNWIAVALLRSAAVAPPADTGRRAAAPPRVG